MMRLAEGKKTVILDEGMTEAKAHIRGTGRELSGQRFMLVSESGDLGLVTTIWCWTNHLVCLCLLPYLFSTSHSWENQTDTKVYQSIKCCLRMGTVVNTGKLKYQKTRQANRDLMLQTRGLNLAVHRPEICFVWTTQWFLLLLLSLF